MRIELTCQSTGRTALVDRDSVGSILPNRMGAGTDIYRKDGSFLIRVRGSAEDVQALLSDTTEKKILVWAEQVGILEKATVHTQFGKLVEEVEELRKDIDADRNDSARVELGDCLVVLTILADMLGTDAETCAALAHAKNETRDGEMVDGVFVKCS